MEQWNGSAWAQVTTPAVPGSNGPGLYGVSCTSANFCQAVGGGGAGGAPIALQWNGSTWSAQTMGLPSNANNGALLSASCTTASFCMAVGTGSNGIFLVSMAYAWNGSTWTQTTLPTTGNIFVTAYVSCAGLTFCAATAGNPGPVNQILTWNGSSWNVAQNVPTPTGGGTLNGISCFSTTSCAAVGTNGAATQVAHLRRPVVDAGEQPTRRRPGNDRYKLGRRRLPDGLVLRGGWSLGLLREHVPALARLSPHRPLRLPLRGL